MLLPEETRNIKKSLEKLFGAIYYPAIGTDPDQHNKSLTVKVPAINKQQMLGLAAIAEEEQCDINIDGSFRSLNISFNR